MSKVEENLFALRGKSRCKNASHLEYPCTYCTGIERVRPTSFVDHDGLSLGLQSMHKATQRNVDQHEQ